MFPRGLDGTLLSRMASNPWYVPNAAKHQGAFRSWHTNSPREFIRKNKFSVVFNSAGLSLSWFIWEQQHHVLYLNGLLY